MTSATRPLSPIPYSSHHSCGIIILGLSDFGRSHIQLPFSLPSSVVHPHNHSLDLLGTNNPASSGLSFKPCTLQPSLYTLPPYLLQLFYLMVTCSLSACRLTPLTLSLPSSFVRLLEQSCKLNPDIYLLMPVPQQKHSRREIPSSPKGPV